MGYRIIYVDMTTGTAVNPSSNTLTAPQTIKSWQLDASDDEYITVFAEFSIQQFASTNIVIQAIPLILNIGANTYQVNVSPATTATNVGATRIIQPLWFTAVSRAGDLVTAQLGVAGSSDSGTYVNVTGFKIVAESGTRQGT
jgi:hypothetical protein